MAEIFLARGVGAAGVERYCVLKRILRDRASDVHFVRMFLDEARLAAQLNHANVAQVYDIGKLGDSYFFTMEYVHGETVRALLQRARSLRRELPTAAVLTVIAGTASGLHHAHDRIGTDGRPLNIVHRDVSPSNLMVGYEGGVKVVDFGVAKAADRMQETRSGTVKGKISYLSPEQCRGLPVDRRSDLFALGIVMWEMLTTERLFRRASDFENMTAIVTEPPPAPSSRRKSVPPELDAITLRLLAKDPKARFQTGEEVVEALEDAAVRTGAMISTAGLGRLLREMFGQRPEPWLELDHETVPVEGVTVTSEPIPSELGVPIADDMDLHLSAVPDLGSQRVVSNGDGIPRPSQPAPTQPLRVSQPWAVVAPVTVPARPAPTAPTAPTATTAPAQPALPAELPLPPPPASGIHVLAPSGPRPAPVTPTGSLLPPSGGQPAQRPSGGALPPPVPSSGGHALQLPSGGHALQLPSGGHALQLPSGGHAVQLTGSGAQAVHPSSGAPAVPAPTPTRSWPMIAVIGAAAVIGSLTVWIAMKAGGRAKPPPDAAAVVVTAIPIDPIDAGEDAPAVIDIDAAEHAVVAIDAAERVAIAAAIDAGDTPTIEPIEIDGTPTPSPLELAINEGRYADAVTACGRKPVTADTAALCTIAACHEHLEARARGWFAKVATGRPKLLGTCRGLGVDLSVSRPRPRTIDAGVADPCELDPRACQH